MVNVKAAMSRFVLGPPPLRLARPNAIEYIAWFRFPVTWTYLGSTVQDVRPELPIQHATGLAPAPAVRTLASTDPARVEPAPAVLDSSLISGNPRPAALSGDSKTVMSKMIRPPAGPPVERLPAPSPPPVSAAPASAKETAPAEAGYVEPPILQFASEETFLARFGPQSALAAVAVLAVGLLLLGYSGTDSSSPKLIEWSHRFSSPPGRLLFLYQPSRGESDYNLEFSWVPSANSAGWVLRARDENNYYATRLILRQPAPNMVLAAEHFSMLGGVEGPHSRKMIPLGNHSGLVQIQMAAIGSTFTLSLQSKPVDSWTDTQLISGAFGFFDDTGERPKIQDLHFTFTKKGATRTAVASLP